MIVLRKKTNCLASIVFLLSRGLPNFMSLSQDVVGWYVVCDWVILKSISTIAEVTYLPFHNAGNNVY